MRESCETLEYIYIVFQYNSGTSKKVLKLHDYSVYTMEYDQLCNYLLPIPINEEAGHCGIGPVTV